MTFKDACRFAPTFVALLGAIWLVGVFVTGSTITTGDFWAAFSLASLHTVLSAIRGRGV